MFHQKKSSYRVMKFKEPQNIPNSFVVLMIMKHGPCLNH